MGKRVREANNSQEKKKKKKQIQNRRQKLDVSTSKNLRDIEK